MKKLYNGTIAIDVAERGAELVSLRRGDTEYLWCGDAKFWGRHAPILFPIVGKVAGGEYRVDGKAYRLPQHGFARDTDFVAEDCADAIRMVMPAEGFLDVYPYRFGLSVEYRLEGDTVEVDWKVENHDVRTLYFQIGAHPAFNLRNFSTADLAHGYVDYQGLRIPLTRNTFDNDALIDEDSSIDEMTLLDKLDRPYVRVECRQAQVWGIWSPTGKDAPFVCLEPWCGRKDDDGFVGDIAERRYIQSLAPGAEYHFVYRIAALA